MRILITGACGFVGHHLAKHLLSTTSSAELHGTVLPGLPYKTQPDMVFHELDLKNVRQVDKLVADLRPEYIYHLAAQAFVPRSFEAPWETLENNIRSQLNIILACLKIQIAPHILIISSAEIYGPASIDELPLTEESRLRPTSPYSVSKIAQDMMGLQYYHSHNLPIMRARAFNHIGPGQNARFVAPDFASQVARIEANMQPPVIHVGDLTAERDFTDVRDIVRAYRIIIEKGTPGEVYNVCTGETHSIQSILDRLIRLSASTIEVVVDPSRLRPTSIPVLVGDNSRLRNATGWQPQIPIDQTLADVLEDCRCRIRQ